MSRHAFTRVVLTTRTNDESVFHAPIAGNQNVVSYKALLRRSSNYYAVKVGAFGSPNRVGQTLQAVGTSLIPGDISGIRSPLRSAVYSALTPGGGRSGFGGGVPSREERGYRCPEGFQYGGRFTDSRFSTCGQMLFDVFSLGATVAQLLKPSSSPAAMARTGGAASPIPGLSPQEQQIIISRAAQIPRVGPANQARRAQSVRSAANAIEGAQDGVTLMVRRDGFMMRPVVSTAILRTVPDNRNMEGATYITSTRSLSTLGGEELGLLSNTGVTELLYVGSENVQLSLRKTRPLTVGERRKLGKVVVQAAQTDNSDDPTRRFRMLVDASNGGIEYSESFGSVDRPNDIVSVFVSGKKRQMRRWAFEAFVRDKTKKRGLAQPIVQETVETNDSRIQSKITSLAKAIKHLEQGGDPEAVLPSLLPVALQRTRGYQSRRIDKLTKRHLKPGKHEITEHSAEFEYEHLSTRVAADFQKLLGVEADNVLLAGQGTRSPYLSVEKIRAGQELLPADNLDNMSPAQVLALAVSDYVVDHRDRRPKTTQIVKIGDRTYIRSANNKLTLLAGLPRKQASARERMGVDDFMNDARQDYYSVAFRNLTESQRRLVVNQLDNLLDRLRKFSWEEYISRLRLDGQLSQAEMNHLKIVQSLVEARTSSLTSSKKRFLDLLSGA